MTNNLHAEATARKTVCPLLALCVAVSSGMAFADFKCITSRCAMWRRYDASHGYCGLAGERK